MALFPFHSVMPREDIGWRRRHAWRMRENIERNWMTDDDLRRLSKTDQSENASFLGLGVVSRETISEKNTKKFHHSNSLLLLMMVRVRKVLSMKNWMLLSLWIFSHTFSFSTRCSAFSLSVRCVRAFHTFSLSLYFLLIKFVRYLRAARTTQKNVKHMN